jgi:hypothetical protein
MIFRRQGFKVKLKGRTGVEYVEGNRTLVLSCESLASTGMVIYSDSLGTWQTPDGVSLSEDEKVRIKANVTDDLTRHHIHVEWW